SPFGFRLRANAILRPGWCVMQGRLFAVGMAATPEGDRTRFAHFEALSLPGSRVLAPLLRHRIHHEFEALELLARAASRPLVRDRDYARHRVASPASPTRLMKRP